MKSPSMMTILALLVLSAPALAEGDRPEIATDRPDFTEGPTAVPTGSVQWEGGFTLERSDGSSFLSGPEGLLRWGAARRVEVRFGVPNYVDTDGFSGFGDASIGGKLEIGTHNGTDVGVIAMLSLPTGAAGLTSDAVEPTVILTAGGDFDEAWSLGGQVSASWLELDKRTFEYAATLVLGRALLPNVNAFLELAGILDEHGNGSLLVHHGYTFPVTPDLQFDVHGGIGLTHDAPDGFFGAGFAVRK